MGKQVTTGETPTPTVRFHAASKLVESAVPFTSSSWTPLGGVVSNPGFFLKLLTEGLARITGSIKTDGTIELRVTEDGVQIQSALYEHGDTGGAWQIFKFTADGDPQPGDHEYCLEGRVVGATSAEVRFTSMSLLELEYR